MASRGSNAGEELELLRKTVQDRDTCIRVMLRVIQGTGCTDAQHAEAEATIASLRETINAREVLLATEQRALRVHIAALGQAVKECMGLDAQRRSAIETLMSVVDEAKSRVKAEKTLTPEQKNDLFETAMDEISAKGSIFLHQADEILQSKFEGPQSDEESIPSFQPPQKVDLGDDQQNAQVPTSTASSYNKPALAPKATIASAVPQPQAPKLAASLDTNPVFGAQATTTTMAQRLPQQPVQEPKHKLFAPTPTSFTSFIPTPVTVPQLPVPMVSTKLVQPWFGSKGTTAPMAQRKPKQPVQQSKSSPFTPSWNPFGRGWGTDVTGQGKDVPPESPVKFPMPDSGKTNAKRRNGSRHP